MESESPICPANVTVRRNPPRKAKLTPAVNNPDCTTSLLPNGIRALPLEEILQCNVPQKPLSNVPPSSEREHSENLRVYLRIRPFNTAIHSKRNGGGAKVKQGRLRGISPKKEKTKNLKDNEVCLVVNNSQSVTLSPPQSMQDSKRAKVEVYDGFNHVFEPEATQREVYETVMDPLVSEFILGKSGMLVAMGPSGSGKTHTIFGCPREPGLVSRTLQKLFNSTDGKGSSEMSRSFYVSMFEIYSERGKGERIIDLSSDGSDLCFQQSVVKGLQEVMVSSVIEAEALIARGMLKRTTAMTNSNSQSSRSQCIINIHGAYKEVDGEVEVQRDSAVLTIVDLAGAEREKKTGNQGMRLLESNFINNTSLVFGLCLRSLLEHQKNPKKPLQKHFQNSLLTRYLRDYLEGKKRMTLILTVKSGSDDYLDTSFLLRQASPYMKIKYNNVSEPNLKRNISTFPRVEQPKRQKLSDLDVPEAAHRKNSGDSQKLKEKEMPQPETLQISSSSQGHDNMKMNESALLKEYCVELAGAKRNEKVMQKFSRALWNVLKQYKKKLEESENKVQTLERSLEEEKARYMALEKELTHVKSLYSSQIQDLAGASSSFEGGKEAKFGVPPSRDHKPNNIRESWFSPHKDKMLSVEEKQDIAEKQDTGKEQGLKRPLQIFGRSSEEKTDANDLEVLQNVGIMDKSSSDYITGTDLVPSELMASCSQIQVLVSHGDCSSRERNILDTEEISGSFSEEKTNADDLKVLQNVGVAGTVGLVPSESRVNHSQTQALVGRDDCSSWEQNIIDNEEASSSSVVPSKEEEGWVDAKTASENDPSHRSPRNVVKPRRRRLLPASSILLDNVNRLDLEEENEKAKGQRGGRKMGADGVVGQTQGSISLLRLLGGVRL